MKVVFLEDVAGVAQGGDVKDVKNGFARNYLIPKQLAVPATKSALQRIQRLTREAEVKRVKTLEDMREFAEALNGARVDVPMRAGPNGRLYGSVTNAIVAERLSEVTEREIDRRTVEVTEPIREVGLFDIAVRLHTEVEAGIQVLVYPTGTDPEDMLKSDEIDEEQEDDTYAGVDESAEEGDEDDG